MTSFHLVWTLTLFIVFVAIVLWAWSSRRKQDFEEAAALPLEDDRDAVIPIDRKNNNG